MVLLILTPALKARLEALQDVLPSEIVEEIAFHLDSTPSSTITSQSTLLSTVAAQNERTDAKIDHEVLVKVSEWVQIEKKRDERLESIKGGTDQYRLAQLLKLTTVHAPPLQPREKSPELLAILARIQLEQDQISYNSMTSLHAPTTRSLLPMRDPFDPSTRFGSTTSLGLGMGGSSSKSVSEEWKEIKREMAAIVNVLASMMAVATAVWWVGGGRSVGARLGLSMLGALSIGAIEGFLYYRFFTKLAAAQEQHLSMNGKKRNGGGKSSTMMGVLKFEQGKEQLMGGGIETDGSKETLNGSKERKKLD